MVNQNQKIRQDYAFKTIEIVGSSTDWKYYELETLDGNIYTFQNHRLNVGNYLSFSEYSSEKIKNLTSFEPIV